MSLVMENLSSPMVVGGGSWGSCCLRGAIYPAASCSHGVPSRLLGRPLAASQLPTVRLDLSSLCLFKPLLSSCLTTRSWIAGRLSHAWHPQALFPNFFKKERTFLRVFSCGSAFPLFVGEAFPEGSLWSPGRAQKGCVMPRVVFLFSLSSQTLPLGCFNLPNVRFLGCSIIFNSVLQGSGP